MLKALVSALLFFPALSLNAQNLPPGLPGITMQDAPAPEETAIQRPDAMRVLADLGPELRLSENQEVRITRAVEKKGKEFDVIFKEYEKADAEEKKWRYRVNDLKHKLGSINRSVPDGIRDFLDDEQRLNFDAMLEARRNPKPAAPPEEVSAAKPEASPVSAAATKPLKKKRLVKRKKIPAAGAASAVQPADSAAAVAEEEAGQTLVDMDSSPAQVKKRVQRKKAASAAPAVKEAPAAEEAGSYP